MFIQETPPKFVCDHCKSTIQDDNVTFFYRGRHLHPECFASGVEKIKYQDLRGEKVDLAPIIPAPRREFRPVDLAPPSPEIRTAYGYPKT